MGKNISIPFLKNDMQMKYTAVIRTLGKGGKIIKDCLIPYLNRASDRQAFSCISLRGILCLKKRSV